MKKIDASLLREPMAFLAYFTGLMLALVFIYGVHIYWPRPMVKKVEVRSPASLSDVLLGGGALIGRGVYNGAAGIGNLTVEFIRPIIIRNKLNGFIDGIELDEEV